MRIWEFEEDNDGAMKAPDGFFGSAGNGRTVALGYFDGVHQGHRKILDQLQTLARERAIPAMVHTFSNLPKSKSIDPQDKGSSLLTTLTEKCSCFGRIGMDETALFPFSETVSSMRALDFMQNHLKELLKAKVIVAGEDYHFGRDREGDMKMLSKWGQENGIQVCSVPPVKHNDQIISSSWIRDCVRNGRITLANLLLGYPLSYEGIVRQGKQLGRSFGFPTANIAVDEEKVVAAYGVYASILSTNGSFYPAITNVGLRPTVNKTDFIPLIETMMYDRDLDLYGDRIRVFLLSFIRPEYRFPDTQVLKEQVHKDMAEVRHYHDLHIHDYSNLLSGVI